MIALHSQGNEVRQWQQYLLSLGYEVSVDGIYGNGTYQATIAFQKWCNIPADGVVGANTYAWAVSNGYEGDYSE